MEYWIILKKLTVNNEQVTVKEQIITGFEIIMVISNTVEFIYNNSTSKENYYNS